MEENANISLSFQKINSAQEMISWWILLNVMFITTNDVWRHHTTVSPAYVCWRCKSYRTFQCHTTPQQCQHSIKSHFVDTLHNHPYHLILMFQSTAYTTQYHVSSHISPPQWDIVYPSVSICSHTSSHSFWLQDIYLLNVRKEWTSQKHWDHCLGEWDSSNEPNHGLAEIASSWGHG